MLDKIIEIIMTILPFLGNRKKRKAMAQDVKEFSELVKDQYTFLMEQLEKVLKDYFDLSARVKEMHTEIFSFTEYDLDVCHRRRGFNGAGYHFYIRKNGDIKSTRPIEKVGAHAKGFNRESIGICYEGGLDSKGRPKDTRTEWQKHSLRVLVLTLLKDYPECRVCGHRDLSPDRNENGEIEPEEWVKACPCFDAENNWKA